MKGFLAAIAATLLLAGCGTATSDQAPTATEPNSAGTSAPAQAQSTQPSPEVSIEATAAAATPEAPIPPAQPSLPTVTVTDVIDGDTIDTTAGRVRVIGIDTPERGECNFGPASSLLTRLIAQSGNQVVLTAVPGKDDTDRYGRLLRYVDTPSGQDLGRELIAAGLAIARYDSRDGYGAHPREADYVALDASVVQVPCPGASG